MPNEDKPPRNQSWGDMGKQNKSCSFMVKPAYMFYGVYPREDDIRYEYPWADKIDIEYNYGNDTYSIKMCSKRQFKPSRKNSTTDTYTDTEDFHYTWKHEYEESYTHYIEELIDVDYIDSDGMGGWSDTYNYNEYYKDYMENHYHNEYYDDSYGSDEYYASDHYYYDPDGNYSYDSTSDSYYPDTSSGSYSWYHNYHYDSTYDPYSSPHEWWGSSNYYYDTTGTGNYSLDSYGNYYYDEYGSYSWNYSNAENYYNEYYDTHNHDEYYDENFDPYENTHEWWGSNNYYYDTTGSGNYTFDSYGNYYYDENGSYSWNSTYADNYYNNYYD